MQITVCTSSFDYYACIHINKIIFYEVCMHVYVHMYIYVHIYKRLIMCLDCLT